MTKPTNYSTFPMPARRRAGEAADVNADFMTTGTLLNTPTLYPSAYLVLTSKGYTKHYYAGADRVAASLGGGGLKAVGSNPGMQDRAKWLFWESHERVNGRMLQKNDLECIWQGSLPTGKYCEPIDGIPGRMNASVEFYLNDLYDNLKMLAEEQHDEKDVYFYHSDHLGSASWITDGNGKPIQHLQYLPFGEPFVNQHLTDYQERYLFTGKERDEETGYGYFGARYMDHELLTSFISVDRYASKYPFISPYAYCAWNPIILTDPSGDTIINKYKGHGGELYARTQQLIDEFQTSHPEEFEYINNLSFENEDGKCTPINIMVGISDEKGPIDPETGTRINGQTVYEFDHELVVYNENGKCTLKDNVIGIKDNKISITLYQRHHNIGTLANEFGDAIFAVSRPQTVYDDRKSSYFIQASTSFSFHYEAFIKGERATRPNPFDLDEYR